MSGNAEQEETLSTYEEEEEVEITDDEDTVASGYENADEPKSPVQSPRTPGKVNPSEEVKNLKMKSPGSRPNEKQNAFPANKNPFTTFGAWTEETMSKIDISVPVLTGKNETTNELTRSTKPEARYWKAPIVFNYENYTSTTIRFDNVHIPYHTANGYGSSFVYLCLPGFAAEKFAEAGKTRRPTIVHERSLQIDRNRWWKVANKVEESFGIVNGETKKFQKKNLSVIFDQTNSGITASVVLSFKFKANTDSKEPLKHTTAGTISVELERGFISATDVNVEPPVRVVTKKQKVDPAAISKDVAGDSLMKRLADLGM